MNKPRIMVINHSPDILHMFEMLLSEEGYDTSIHLFKMASVETVFEEHPDLIILDSPPLQEAQALTMLIRLKDSSITAETPMILTTTAVALNNNIQAAVAKYGINIVYKPFDIEELLATIDISLQQAKSS
jgi:DNA-binding response OmpR family regulator